MTEALTLQIPTTNNTLGASSSRAAAAAQEEEEADNEDMLPEDPITYDSDDEDQGTTTATNDYSDIDPINHVVIFSKSVRDPCALRVPTKDGPRHDKYVRIAKATLVTVMKGAAAPSSRGPSTLMPPRTSRPPSPCAVLRRPRHHTGNHSQDLQR